MTAYQTPTTDFADHADALEASCADLVGPADQQAEHRARTPRRPSAADDHGAPTAPRSTPWPRRRRAPHGPGAVQLQADVRPEHPGAVRRGRHRDAGLVRGLRGRPRRAGRPRSEVVFAGGFGQAWEADLHAPRAATRAASPTARRPTRVTARAAPATSPAGDSITSPAITIPAGDGAARMSFEHYVATEAGYDGGNVKISVNGGAFDLIPAAAYIFNAPAKLDRRATQHQPAGRPGRLHRHRRWRGRRLVGHVAGRPDRRRRRGGRQRGVPVRHGT